MNQIQGMLKQKNKDQLIDNGNQSIEKDSDGADNSGFQENEILNEELFK
jgi:hypothetical protein